MAGPFRAGVRAGARTGVASDGEWASRGGGVSSAGWAPGAGACVTNTTQPTCPTTQATLAIRRRSWRKRVVTPDGKANAGTPVPAVPTCVDPARATALARAFRYERLLDDGPYASITEMADAERLDRGYMGRPLQLTLLAPSLVEVALDGRYALEVDRPSRIQPFSTCWAGQRSTLSRQ